MSHCFLDTSALIKRYIRETGSRWVNALITQPATRVYISRLSEAEVSAAVTRRLCSSAATRLLRHFDHDVTSAYVRIAITDKVIDDAVQLAPTHRLKGCDALQLATVRRFAQFETATLFVCSDNDLLTAAKAEGLKIDNPELHP